MILLFDLEMLKKGLPFNYVGQRSFRDVLSIRVIDIAGARYILWLPS